MELTPETIALLQSSPYGLIFFAAIWAYKKLRFIVRTLEKMENRHARTEELLSRRNRSRR